MKVLLLRHGRTAWNAERRFQGQADPPLDDVGRAQAYEIAALVAAVVPGVLVSSDAVRAVQTAAPIAEVTDSTCWWTRGCGNAHSAIGRG